MVLHIPQICINSIMRTKLLSQFNCKYWKPVANVTATILIEVRDETRMCLSSLFFRLILEVPFNVVK